MMMMMMMMMMMIRIMRHISVRGHVVNIKSWELNYWARDEICIQRFHVCDIILYLLFGINYYFVIFIVNL